MQLKHTLPARFPSLTTQMKPSLLLSVSVQTFVVSIASTAVPSSYYLQKTLELCFVLFEGFFVLFFLLVLFNFHWVLRALTAFLYLLMFS